MILSQVALAALVALSAWTSPAVATPPPSVVYCVGEYPEPTACAVADPASDDRTVGAGGCLSWAPCASVVADRDGVRACLGLSPVGPPYCLPQTLPVP